jgi:two-component sensor histidine kinase
MHGIRADTVRVRTCTRSDLRRSARSDAFWRGILAQLDYTHAYSNEGSVGRNDIRMSATTKPPKAEQSRGSGTPLERRIRQQEILSGLGVKALQGASFNQLLDDAARLTAEGMQAEFCKILEHIPAENCFLVRAGVGWEPGIVGVATIGDDLASPAGFALRTGQPVISNHLENEERFRTPELLVRHGVRRAMNVILQGEGRPFGILEVDSRSEHEFSYHDIAFLQGAANLLGMAIERERYERSLKTALERQQVLLGEITHRVKNGLAIVASMLKLQASEVNNPALTLQLEEAASRVLAVAKAHERIHQSDGPDRLELGAYVKDVCQDLNGAVPGCQIEVVVEPGITVTTDRAVPIALMVNELITNAAKYAYQDSQSGTIWVRVGRGSDDTIELSVRDEGRGLPADFEFGSASGLGMRILRAFSRQLNAALEVRRHDPGTEFVVTAPRESEL